MSTCPRCGAALRPADTEHPPRGVQYQQTPDGFRVTATTRSVMAFIWVPLACLFGVADVAILFGLPVATEKDQVGRMIFGVLFLVATVVLLYSAARVVAGRVEVVKNGDAGVVFDGVG